MQINEIKRTVPVGTTTVEAVMKNGRAVLERKFVPDPDGKTIDITITDIYADAGKVFRRVSDGAVLSGHITLGIADSPDNYIEVAESARMTQRELFVARKQAASIEAEQGEVPAALKQRIAALEAENAELKKGGAGTKGV